MRQFIKDAILQNGVRPPASRRPRIQDQKLLAKLLGTLGKSRIANNINQLAKAANSGSLPVKEEVLQTLNDAVTAIRSMRDSLDMPDSQSRILNFAEIRAFWNRIEMPGIPPVTAKALKFVLVNMQHAALKYGIFDMQPTNKKKKWRSRCAVFL